MPQASPRPFSLFDAMVLVAAMAFGLGGLRVANSNLGELAEAFRESVTAIVHPEEGWSAWAWALYQIYGIAASFSIPFACALTLAVLLLRFRRPRPGIRRLSRQPGLAACFAAAVPLIPSLVGLVGTAIVGGPTPTVFPHGTEWDRWIGYAFILVPAYTGAAVLGAWSLLLISRRWRAEPSWIDRLGRALGLYWIALILLPLWGLW